MGGRTGINYLALEAVMRLLGIEQRKHRKLFKQVRLIESGALSAMAGNNGSKTL